MEKAAQYVRMSTGRQGMSTGIQKEIIGAYAVQHGMQIVRTYADEAKSGVTLNGRPSMKQLLRDVLDDDCEFKIILVLDVSRWGRFQDVDEAAYYEFHCRKNGVRVEYVQENFDTSPIDSVRKHLKRASAAEYSKDLAVKVRAGVVNIVNRGFAAGNLPCLGYRRRVVSERGEPGKLLAPAERKPFASDRIVWVLGPDEEVALVQEIFEEFANGSTVMAIVRRLNAAGIRSQSGKSITYTMIRRLLKSEIVTGVFKWGSRKGMPMSKTNIKPLGAPIVNPNMVPRIVDQETWEATQTKLTKLSVMEAEGVPAEVMADGLREVLSYKPDLTLAEFAKHGLLHASTYRTRFGSMLEAFRAAGRDVTPAEEETSARHCSIHQLRCRLLVDICDLIVAHGVRARRVAPRCMLLINGVEIKVRTARPIRARWVTQNVQTIRKTGRWLLLMRLNTDMQTGIDFFLMPSDALASFSGVIHQNHLHKFEPFRLLTGLDLVGALREIESHSYIKRETASSMK